MSTALVDGRSIRRERNRDAVLDAVIALFEAGNLAPSIDDVSRTSGISHRSIYRYFHHRDALMHEAMWRAVTTAGSMMVFPELGAGTFDERLTAFLQHHLRLYSALAPLTRAARRAAAHQSTIAAEFERGRRMLVDQIAAQFMPELAALPDGDRERAQLALEFGFTFDTWEFLHQACDGDRAEMLAVLDRHIRLHLGQVR